MVQVTLFHGIIPGLRSASLTGECIPTGNGNTTPSTTPSTQILVHMVLPVPILPIGRAQYAKRRNLCRNVKFDARADQFG